MSVPVSNQLAWPPRLLATVPAAIFLTVLAYKASIGLAWEAMWICYVALMLCSLGLALRVSWLARVGALQLLAGLPSWLIGVALERDTTAVSVLAHAGGAWLGWQVLRALGTDGRTWLIAFAAAVAVQLASRWLTPAALNINVAHAPYFPALSASYALNWLGWAASWLGLLWLAETLIRRTRRPVDV